MRAAGGSHKRQPHPIGGCRGAEPDGDSGSDSATSGEAAVARGKLADQLRAAGRAEGAVEAAFHKVPRHAFLPEMEPVSAYQDRAVVIKSDRDGLPVSASTQPAMMEIMVGPALSWRAIVLPLKSRNASSSASSRVGGARQARGSRPGAVSPAAGHPAGDNRRRDHGPGPAACAPRTALAGVVTVCLRGQIWLMAC